MKGIWKFLIAAGSGVIMAFAVACSRGLFGAENASLVLMALCDGFFVSGALLLAAGGLQWTYNGGVMDGLSFTFKTAVARIRRNYEQDKMSFADYREEREKKAGSPKWLLLSGLVQMVIATLLLAAYSNV